MSACNNEVRDLMIKRGELYCGAQIAAVYSANIFNIVNNIEI